MAIHGGERLLLAACQLACCRSNQWYAPLAAVARTLCGLPSSHRHLPALASLHQQQEGITKLKRILEGDKSEAFTAEHYMMLCEWSSWLARAAVYHPRHPGCCHLGLVPPC